MGEEVVYVFEMLDPHSSSASVAVRVAAPTGARLHPLTRTVMQGLTERLGHKRVMFVSPCGGLTEERSDMSCPAGLYFAYVYAEGRAKPPLWEMLLAGAHQMVVRGMFETATPSYRAVLGRRRDDPDLIFSLFRHLRETVPSMQVQHEAFALCRHFDAINHALGQRRVQRQAQLMAWSAAPAHDEDVVGGAISLLQLMRMLPPPFTPVDVLPLGSLVRLAQTCRAWYAYVVGSLLLRLLRRALDKPTLAKGSWSFLDELEGPREDVWSNCTLTTTASDIVSTTPPPPVMKWMTEAVPVIVRCPMLLRWMLTHEQRTSAAEAKTIVADDHTKPVAVTNMLKRLHNEIRAERCPTDDVKRCLGLAGLLAHGAVTFESGKTGFPVNSEHHMIYLRLVIGDEEEEDVEVLCDVEWGVKAYSYY